MFSVCLSLFSGIDCVWWGFSIPIITLYEIRLLFLPDHLTSFLFLFGFQPNVSRWHCLCINPASCLLNKDLKYQLILFILTAWRLFPCSIYIDWVSVYRQNLGLPFSRVVPLQILSQIFYHLWLSSPTSQRPSEHQDSGFSIKD